MPNTEVHRGEMPDYPMQGTIKDYLKRRDPEWALALKLAKLNDAQFSAGFEQGLQ